MYCPACGKNMVQQDFGGVTVDVCVNNCGSLWFDWGELSRLDDNNEGYGDALDAALNSPRASDANRGHLNCPKCGIPMQIHRYPRTQNVMVDECYACGGFFLDSGELKATRDNMMTEAEEKAYAQKVMATLPEYWEAENSMRKEKERNAAIQRHRSFLRRRCYFPYGGF